MDDFQMRIFLKQIIDFALKYKQRTAYVAGSDNMLTEYFGLALPGTAESDPKWIIIKNSYSGNAQTGTDFAGGKNEFAFSWTNRESYTYS